MQYLILPFVLVLALIELVLRATLPVLAVVATIGFALLSYDSHGRDVAEFVKTNVCFDLAKKMVP